MKFYSFLLILFSNKIINDCNKNKNLKYEFFFGSWDSKDLSNQFKEFNSRHGILKTRFCFMNRDNLIDLWIKIYFYDGSYYDKNYIYTFIVINLENNKQYYKNLKKENKNQKFNVYNMYDKEIDNQYFDFYVDITNSNKKEINILETDEDISFNWKINFNKIKLNSSFSIYCSKEEFDYKLFIYFFTIYLILSIFFNLLKFYLIKKYNILPISNTFLQINSTLDILYLGLMINYLDNNPWIKLNNYGNAWKLIYIILIFFKITLLLSNTKKIFKDTNYLKKIIFIILFLSLNSIFIAYPLYIINKIFIMFIISVLPLYQIIHNTTHNSENKNKCFILKLHLPIYLLHCSLLIYIKVSNNIFNFSPIPSFNVVNIFVLILTLSGLILQRKYGAKLSETKKKKELKVEIKIEDDLNNLFSYNNLKELKIDNKYCSICMINFSGRETNELTQELLLKKQTSGCNKLNIILTSCNHVFHIHCIKSWMERQNTCPICRSKLPKLDN